MRKSMSILLTMLFSGILISSFAGNSIQVIIPGDHSPRSFSMPSNIKEDDYLANTVIFKVKPEFSQNCKVNSVDNLLPMQDFLKNVNAQDLAKIFPRHTAPVRKTNELGQKMADLSTIYSFKYNSPLSINKVINGMLSLGYFEYVEPWYVPKTMLSPNDPDWSTNQYYLQGAVTGSINTVNAWDVTQGDTSVVIGIIDTGTQLDHPDLQPNIKLNYADPIDGIDNDSDGYIDNYQGWDFGMNDNDPSWEGNPHGVATSGDACAATDNGIGVASPGFNCRFLPIKGGNSAGILVAVYPGVVYAADHGAKIISNSWGSSGGGSYGQDIMDYVAINKNCLVFASAGNKSADDLTYPASYNNVYRVSSTTSSDALSGFSSYGMDVDFAAPGTNIHSTMSGSTYTQMSGTSMACPVAAGAAGLIQSKFNYTNAFQIGERLKQTCDSLPANSQWVAGKLGKGRINVGNAVSSVAAKSIILNPVTIIDGNDNVFMPGESLSISGIFTNYFDPTSASASATLSIISGSAFASVTQGNFTLGALTTLSTTNNTSSPFTVNILSTAPVNQAIKFKIKITDGAFSNSQYFSITVNPDYIDVTINDVFTTITSKGRIGYNLDMQVQGLGFQYQLPSPQDMLYEMSLMIGNSATNVSDMFSDGSVGNTDFGAINRVKQVAPSVVSDLDLDGTFNDAPATTTGPLKIEVHHSAYAWITSPYRKFVIVKYIIKNTDAVPLSNLYAGILADWDVPNANSGQNKSGWDSTAKMGYVYFVNGPGPYAAIKLLSNTAPVNNYFIDLITGGNGGVDAFSDLTTSEKYSTLTTSRNADAYGATGGDIMDCVSSGPFTINPGDSIEVAFALIGGDDIADLKNSSCAAQAKYDNGCTMGVNDLENNNFWIYNFPNPAVNTVNFNYNLIGYKNASIRIVNALGETVRTINNLITGENTLTVDVSKFTSGTYFYQFKADDTAITKKLTIVR